MKLELPKMRFCPQCGGETTLSDTEGRLRPVCRRCGNIIYINPVPAAAVVLIRDGHVLLTLRNVEPKKGWWCLPGGFMEWGESPEESARRELLEETGISAGALELLGVWDSVSTTHTHVLVVGYRAIEWSGEAIAGDDAAEVEWFPVNDTPELAFGVHKRALAAALQAIGSGKDINENTGC